VPVLGPSDLLNCVHKASASNVHILTNVDISDGMSRKHL
jgi:hypothetical protein